MLLGKRGQIVLQCYLFCYCKNKAHKGTQCMFLLNINVQSIAYAFIFFKRSCVAVSYRGYSLRLIVKDSKSFNIIDQIMTGIQANQNVYEMQYYNTSKNITGTLTLNFNQRK